MPARASAHAKQKKTAHVHRQRTETGAHGYLHLAQAIDQRQGGSGMTPLPFVGVAGRGYAALRLLDFAWARRGRESPEPLLILADGAATAGRNGLGRAFVARFVVVKPGVFVDAPDVDAFPGDDVLDRHGGRIIAWSWLL
jgi:hypothetical protein